MRESKRPTFASATQLWSTTRLVLTKFRMDEGGILWIFIGTVAHRPGKFLGESLPLRKVGFAVWPECLRAGEGMSLHGQANSRPIRIRAGH